MKFAWRIAPILAGALTVALPVATGWLVRTPLPRAQIPWIATTIIGLVLVSLLAFSLRLRSDWTTETSERLETLAACCLLTICLFVTSWLLAVVTIVLFGILVFRRHWLPIPTRCDDFDSRVSETLLSELHLCSQEGKEKITRSLNARFRALGVSSADRTIYPMLPVASFTVFLVTSALIAWRVPGALGHVQTLVYAAFLSMWTIHARNLDFDLFRGEQTSESVHNEFAQSVAASTLSDRSLRVRGLEIVDYLTGITLLENASFELAKDESAIILVSERALPIFAAVLRQKPEDFAKGRVLFPTDWDTSSVEQYNPSRKSDARTHARLLLATELPDGMNDESRRTIDLRPRH